MNSTASSASMAAKVKSSRHSEAQWAAQKINIGRLYITEDRTLKVIQILDREFGFKVRYFDPTLQYFKSHN